MLHRPVYMDNHATTACDPRVVAAMLPISARSTATPRGRNHVFGWKAEEAVERARAQVAARDRRLAAGDRVHVGRNRGDNLMLKGAARVLPRKGRPHRHARDRTQGRARSRASRFEAEGLRGHGRHAATRRTRRRGDDRARADRPHDPSCQSCGRTTRSARSSRSLRSAGCRRERGTLFAVDAAQAVGKVPVDVEAAQVDLLALSGTQALRAEGRRRALRQRASRRVRLAPAHRRWRTREGARSGTLNVPGIVGHGRSVRARRRPKCRRKPARLLRAARPGCYEAIATRLEGVPVNGTLAGTAPARQPEPVVRRRRGRGAAARAARHRGLVGLGVQLGRSIEPSHVITRPGRRQRPRARVDPFRTQAGSTPEEVDFVRRPGRRDRWKVAHAGRCAEGSHEMPAPVRMRIAEPKDDTMSSRRGEHPRYRSPCSSVTR